jgi:hypothetical protein
MYYHTSRRTTIDSWTHLTTTPQSGHTQGRRRHPGVAATSLATPTRNSMPLPEPIARVRSLPSPGTAPAQCTPAER